MFLALSPKGGGDPSWRNLFFLRFASYASSGPGPRERFCGTRPRAQGPAGAVNAVPRGLRGRCPARSPLCAAAVCVVSARRSPPFFSGLPRSCLLGLGCPAQSPWGTLSGCVTQMGTPRSGLARRGQPSRPLSLRSRRPGAAPGAEAQPQALAPALGSPGPLLAAALCPSPVPSPLAPAPSRRGWPAEGPVGPEICHSQGGERPLGEEPCRCILFSKKIKYFHGKLSLCVFLSPLSPSVPFSWVVFQGQLRVSFPWRPHPAALSWLLLWAQPCLGPGLCGGWHAPARHLCRLRLALAGRGRVRGWPSGRRSTVSHGSLSASCAFPLCRPSLGSAHQASDTPWLVCSVGLPAASPQRGGRGRVSWLPTPHPYPHLGQHRGFAPLGKSLRYALQLVGVQGNAGRARCPCDPSGQLSGPALWPQRLCCAEHRRQTCCPRDQCTAGTRQGSWDPCDGQRSWSRGRPGASWPGGEGQEPGAGGVLTQQAPWEGIPKVEPDPEIEEGARCAQNRSGVEGLGPFLLV